MPVNPLDLQVSFSQMNQVGKQQAVLKESDDVKQEQASQLLNKLSSKDTEEVPETKDVNEGAGKIKDKEKEEKNKQKKKEQEEQKEIEKNKEEDKDKKDLKDPTLGQKIDILG
jgi:hypothetical protein